MLHSCFFLPTPSLCLHHISSSVYLYHPFVSERYIHTASYLRCFPIPLPNHSFPPRLFPKAPSPPYPHLSITCFNLSLFHSYLLPVFLYSCHLSLLLHAFRRHASPLTVFLSNSSTFSALLLHSYSFYHSSSTSLFSRTYPHSPLPLPPFPITVPAFSTFMEYSNSLDRTTWRINFHKQGKRVPAPPAPHISLIVSAVLHRLSEGGGGRWRWRGVVGDDVRMGKEELRRRERDGRTRD